tara:strand:- start:164 stop:337 length:174 start_codon:yes stop_codon:yes gene_type:complete
MLPKKQAGVFRDESDLNASLSRRDALIKQGTLIQKMVWSNEDCAGEISNMKGSASGA